MSTATRFHPSEFILDELDARNWSRLDLAERMGGGNIVLNQLTLDLYIEAGPTNRGMRLGDMAGQLAFAFGTSRKLWENLERVWLEG